MLMMTMSVNETFQSAVNIMKNTSDETIHRHKNFIFILHLYIYSIKENCGYIDSSFCEQ